MVNKTHLKVLIKKDLITLWRSKGFLISFIILPIVLIGLFNWIKSLVDNGEKSGSLIYDNFRYSSTLPPDFSKFP
jgi:ABC-type Na+ efflux pump permease subunit